MNESRISAALTDSLAVGASLRLAFGPHAQHHAVVFLGVDADVTVRLPGGAAARGRNLLVAPDVAHAAACPGVAVGLLYDPEAYPAIAAAARRAGPLAVLDGRLGEALAAHRAHLDRPEVLLGFARESASSLAAGATSRPVDRRVARVVEELRQGRAPAPPAGISPAHLSALFVRDVGLPLRSYRLWRRLLDALRVFPQTGATHAAHLAGFADLAHFSRTCSRMLGTSPTALRDTLLAR